MASSVMFQKDQEEIKKSVRTVKAILLVTFIGLATMWGVFVGYALWRLGPGGYTRDDAKEDRQVICEALKTYAVGDANKDWVCPLVPNEGKRE